MSKQILIDYINAFSWNNIKEKDELSIGVVWLYFLIVYPLTQINSSDCEMEVVEWVRYFTIIIPPIYASAMAKLLPVSMSKQLFLMPMSKQERMGYMDDMQKLKFLIPVVMIVIGAVLNFAFGTMDIVVAMEFIVSNILMALVYSMHVNSFNNSLKSEKGIFTTSMSGTLLVCELIMPIIVIVFCLVYVASDDLYEAPYMKWIIVFFVVIIQLPITIAYAKCWPTIREKFSEYETYRKIAKTNKR